MGQLERSGSRHAVVTGASSGIGRAIVEQLLADGWRVTGLCRSPIETTDGSLKIGSVDVTDFAALRTMCDALGVVDAVVHAAGLMRTAPLGQLSHENGAAMWRLPVESAAFLADRLVPRMPADGRVVLLGSRTTKGATTRSQYAATKSALVGLARSWAAELAPKGITVTSSRRTRRTRRSCGARGHTPEASTDRAVHHAQGSRRTGRPAFC